MTACVSMAGQTYQIAAFTSAAGGHAGLERGLSGGLCVRVGPQQAAVRPRRHVPLRLLPGGGTQTISLIGRTVLGLCLPSYPIILSVLIGGEGAAGRRAQPSPPLPLN